MNVSIQMIDSSACGPSRSFGCSVHASVRVG